MPENAAPLPDFTRWPSFPFEGDMRVKDLAAPVAVEPPRSGEDSSDCVACNTPDDAYIWENERWRVRAMDRPTGLPMVLILECRSHLDMGDLPNLLAAELGVMTVRLERAIRSLDGVARVHVNRWGDGSAHLHMWFLARPYGRLQLRGTFLSLWDDILPTIPEDQWRENLALVAAWLAEFGGHANTEPAHIEWQSPSTFSVAPLATGPGTEYVSASSTEPTADAPGGSGAPAESGAVWDDPALGGAPDTGNNDSDRARSNATDSAGTDSGGPGETGALAGSGSDHGSSTIDEGATTAEFSETGASKKAAEQPAEPGPLSSRADPSADSEDTGEHVPGSGENSNGAGDHFHDGRGLPLGENTPGAGEPSQGQDARAAGEASRGDDAQGAGEASRGEGAQGAGEASRGENDADGSAGVWVADADKGLWRPSDLGEAERPAPNAETKMDPPSPAGATSEDTENRRPVLHDPHTDSVGEDGDRANTAADRAALTPRTNTETLAASSTAGQTPGTAGDQTEAAETAGTRRP